jgi:hypothetical protein
MAYDRSGTNEGDVTEALINRVRRALLDRLATEHYVVNAAGSEAQRGDAVVVLDGPNVRVRVVQDRGQLFAGLTDADGEAPWVDISFVRQLLAGADEPLSISSGEPFSVELADFLSGAADQLAELFAAENREDTSSRLRRLKRASARKRFGG